MTASDTTGVRVQPPAQGAARAVLCPYCGGAAAGGRCAVCGGRLDPLSIQATQNEMGPWFIRDEAHPFRPGCSYETLARLVDRARVTGDTVIRGPTTRQFWSFARNVRGVSHLLGECHACHGPAGRDEYMCRSCGAVFEPVRDRQHFGAGAVRLLPGQAPPEIVARSAAPARPTPATRPPADDTRRQADAALKRARRELARSRRLVTVSIAVNVALLATVLIAALTPGLLERRSPPPTAPEADPASPTLAGVEAEAPVQGVPAIDPGLAADLAEAQRLLETDTFESLRQAERLLSTAVEHAGEAGAPPEATDLLRRVRQRLDARSLEGLTGAPQTP